MCQKRPDACKCHPKRPLPDNNEYYNEKKHLLHEVYHMHYKNEIYTYESSNTILYCDKTRTVQLKNLRFSGFEQIFKKKSSNF